MGAHRRSSVRLQVAVVGALLLGVLAVGSPAATPLTPEAGTAPPVFDLAWGARGGGESQFEYPTGIDVAPNGDVYVADRANHRIQRFSATGTFLSSWTGSGSENGQFSNPTDVAVDGNGNVYVTDEGNHRIQTFTATGTYLTQWGTLGGGDGSFTYPSGVVVTAEGDVYVTDSANHRVQRFTSTGTFLGKWGESGTAAGQFNYPGGIAEAANGEILVADGNDRVQRFSPTGDYLGRFASGFSDPVAVDVDSEGDVYVSDQANHRIQAFSPTGTFLFQWGTNGSGEGQFVYPHGVAVGPQDSVYVVDHFNHRVQRFVTPPAPSLSVTKTADQTSVIVGEPIDYQVTVTNTGNQALTGVTVSDPNAPACDGPVADLPVGGTPVVVDCSYTPTDDDVGTYTNVATVDSDQTDPVASDPIDVTVERIRPDARIRRGTGPTAGNNIYNGTGVDQTRRGSVRAGGSVTFTVTFENDGTTADDFVVRGPASNTRFKVTYRVAGADVTGAVTAGTQRFEAVPAGAIRSMTVTVKAKSAARRGAVFTAKVRVTSELDPTKLDVVKAVVTRI